MNDERREPKVKLAELPASFEQAIQHLGEIVQRLEAGELSLEESLAAFERGIVLARDAQRRLDAAESRVEELLGIDEQGRALTRPVEARGSEFRASAPDSPNVRARPGDSPTPAPTASRTDPEGPLHDDDDMPF